MLLSPIDVCMLVIYRIPSMYGIFTYIWLIFMVNVGEYAIPMDPMGTILGIPL